MRPWSEPISSVNARLWKITSLVWIALTLSDMPKEEFVIDIGEHVAID